jgi:hypothetical protein
MEVEVEEVEGVEEHALTFEEQMALECSMYEHKDAMDVSDVFWVFVDLVNELGTSDDLKETDAFAFMGEYRCHPLKIRKSVLLFLDDAGGDAEDYIHFEHINTLFYGARTFLRRHRKVSLAQRVDSCIQKMCEQIEMEQAFADISM